jgi:hypothetical protein
VSGPKIAAALFGAALLLTVAFQQATQAVLGPPVREAIGNVDALAAGQEASRTNEDRPKRRAEPRRRAVNSDAPKGKGWQANESGWSTY